MYKTTMLFVVNNSIKVYYNYQMQILKKKVFK